MLTHKCCANEKKENAPTLTMEQALASEGVYIINPNSLAHDYLVVVGAVPQYTAYLYYNKKSGVLEGFSKTAWAWARFAKVSAKVFFDFEEKV